MTARKRRDHGSGSVYQRSSDGLWVGTIEAGWTATGARRRLTVSDKTEAGAKRKLRDKRAALERGEIGASERTTVKAWSQTWLAMKEQTLRPKAYAAAASPVRRWIVPTIGHRRLTQLTPADVRAVATAQRDAGRKGATAAATHRTLMNMLRAAIREGHVVPQRVLLTEPPSVSKSDRQPLTIAQTLTCLAVAAELPHGTRWVFALLHGMRQAECLGLTWDSLVLDGDDPCLVVSWQLQALPYVGDGRKDKAAGFRVPRDYEAVHLVDAWHLVRPKSREGLRVIPLVPAVRDALVAWRDVAPPNPWGLVWPGVDGHPADPDDDREEWQAIQCTAEVGHPGGRWYHVHECRNVTASSLRKAAVDDQTITALLGHASISTSRGYMGAVDLGEKRAALELVARMLGVGD